jgi:DNA-binding NarL/FixJ family response regulator
MEGASHPEGGRPVASEAQRRVVILYEHALLGEGIAKYLRTQLGVEATVASALDLQAVASALALRPAVVIFELGEALQSVDLTTLAPDAVLIDVSTVVARGLALSPDAAGLHRILQAVRESSPNTGPADQSRRNPGE